MTNEKVSESETKFLLPKSFQARGCIAFGTNPPLCLAWHLISGY